MARDSGRTNTVAPSIRDGAPTNTVFGGNKLTAQQRGAAQREMERLLDLLAQALKAANADLPEPILKLYRSPDRAVLQGTKGAISVSWFG
jgi:hypothetical protein